MYYLLTACGLLLGSLLNAQTPQGADRICGEHLRQAGLQGLTYRQAFEKAAIHYADYQEHVFNRMAERKPDFGDIRLLNKLAQEHSEDYFNLLGYSPDGQFHPFGIGEAIVVRWQFSDEAFPSTAVSNLLQQMYDYLAEYRPGEHNRLLKQLMELQEKALLLQQEKEVFAAGIPISLVISACRYWTKRGDEWMAIFGQSSLILQERQSINEQQSEADTSCSCSYWQLQAAAGTAAVKGVINSSAADAASTWYSALVYGCAASAGNFMNQVIHCSVNWWPF